MNIFNHGEVIYVGGAYVYFDYAELRSDTDKVYLIYFYIYDKDIKISGNCPLNSARKINQAEIKKCKEYGFDVSVNLSNDNSNGLFE